MKNFITILVILISFQTNYAQGLGAQGSDKMSYQAIVRNSNNDLIVNQSITMKISILQATVDGTALYVELHSVITNTNGLVTLEIGGGSVVSGYFSDINWSNNIHFVKTETDPLGGTNYTITSTSQLLSVPYALNAKKAENVFSGDYNDLSNKPATLPTYSIGDFAEGGIVFWVDATGQHGLVCYKQDFASLPWVNGGNGGATHAVENRIYGGATNTIMIVTAESPDGIFYNYSYAAEHCHKLTTTENGINYGDWYLPSKYELTLLYTNKTAINTTALNNGGSSFSNSQGENFYWSSNETSSTHASCIHFHDGSFIDFSKGSPIFIRPIRRF